MKKIILILLTLIIYSCDNDDDSLTSINNDGTGGISCLVDGKITTPSGGGIYGNTDVNIDSFDGEVMLYISFSNNNIDNEFVSISMVANDIIFEDLEGQTFQLKEKDTDPNYAEYYSIPEIGPVDYFFTNNVHTGELKIITHDIENQVITGKFWFDAINENDEIVEVREGRFDKKYYIGY